MPFFIGGGVCAILAVVFFFVSRAQARKAYDIASTPTSSAAELTELAQKVAAEIGSGSFVQQVELRGRAVPVEPLKADYSGIACVWYECVATREWEEEYWETDKDGRRERRTRRGSDVVSKVLREPPFRIEDASGAMLLDPRGAKVESEKTHSSFEPNISGGSIRIGGFSLDVGALGFPGAGRRTLGYRFEEKSLPSGRELYALGEAADSGGVLSVRKGAKGRFLISVRSEEQILAGAKGGAQGFMIGSGIAALAALGLAIAGFLRR